MTLPSDVVAVGCPARVVRTASAHDLARLLELREGDLTIPPRTAITIESTKETIAMGQLYAYRGIVPTIAASAVLFPTAEITGDVAVGEHAIIGAGTDIDGFPAVDVGRIPGPLPTPDWALRPDDLPVPAPGGPVQ